VAQVTYELEELRRCGGATATWPLPGADVKDGEQAVSVTKEIAPLLKGTRRSCPPATASHMGARWKKAAKRTISAAVALVMVLTIPLIRTLRCSFSKMAMVFSPRRSAHRCRGGAARSAPPLGFVATGHHRAGRMISATRHPDRPAHRDGRGP
jgi:hypothetical protein